MTDRTGMTFEELIAIQSKHLDHWEPRIEPRLFQEVAQYVTAMNLHATEPTQKHRVYRGQDLIELFRTWPDVDHTCYPKPEAVDSAESMI